MIFISIDPSLTNTAYVVLEYKDNVLTPITYTLSSTEKSKDKKTLVMNDRINRIGQHFKILTALDSEYSPERIMVETPSGSQNSNAAISVGYACSLIAMSNILTDVVTCKPSEVKKQVGGVKPTKKDVINYIESKYPNFLPRKTNGDINLGEAEHIADAIVVAEVCLKNIT